MLRVSAVTGQQHVASFFRSDFKARSFLPSRLLSGSAEFRFDLKYFVSNNISAVFEYRSVFEKVISTSVKKATLRQHGQDQNHQLS